MRRAVDLHHELGAAQFPDYYGENWDALDECLTDLSWAAASGYLLVLSEADQVLADDPAEAQTLVEILNRSAESWSSAMRRATPFHIVWQSLPEDEEGLRNRLPEIASWPTFTTEDVTRTATTNAADEDLFTTGSTWELD